jgi:UDP-glucose:(heptosyl)LPS alpha-1,3-glucosyltransferase
LVRQYGVTPARIAVVSNAADDRMRMPEPARQQSRREIRAEQAIPPDAVALIFVGAGDWKRKGLLAVLRALAELADPQVHLLVVGREDLPFYEAECDRLGVRAVVHFCGFTSQVEHYYAAADIFVYPSQYEAFSLVTLEAAASGLPLVVTRINGTEELVRDGENGLFVEARPDDIAAKLQVLVRDPRLRERLADGARRSSRQFSRAVVLEQTRALLAGFSSVPAEARR